MGAALSSDECNKRRRLCRQRANQSHKGPALNNRGAFSPSHLLSASSANVMKRLLGAAGVEEPVVEAADEVVEKGEVCRTWKLPGDAPVAKSELAKDFGHLVFGGSCVSLWYPPKLP